MADNISNNTTELLPRLSIEERLYNIEKAITEVLAVQKQILNDGTERYVDLRNRIDLNNDKLSVIQRELYQLVQDTRRPAVISR